MSSVVGDFERIAFGGSRPVIAKWPDGVLDIWMLNPVGIVKTEFRKSIVPFIFATTHAKSAEGRLNPQHQRKWE